MNLAFGRRARTKNGKSAKFLIKSDKAEDTFSWGSTLQATAKERNVGGKYWLSVLEYKDYRPGLLCCSAQPLRKSCPD